MTVKEGATGQVRVRVYLRTAIETSVGLDSALRAPVEPAPQATGGRGQAATVVYGSRARDVADVIEERRALPEAPITTDVMRRALETARAMAASGLHRGAKLVDLVIAAAAEAAGLTVLHYDDDYDRIASVMRQPMEWVAPAGSLDR